MGGLSDLLFIFIQMSWGILQNLCGASVFARYAKSPHYRYRQCLVTEWDREDGLSLGLFLFIPRKAPKSLLAHEYGHSVQSLMLGPLFLPVIALPSILWAGLPYFERLRKKKHMTYDDAYQENWANKLGARFAKPENGPKALPAAKPRKKRKAAESTEERI